jgi:hypothetical protein
VENSKKRTGPALTDIHPPAIFNFPHNLSCDKLALPRNNPDFGSTFQREFKFSEPLPVPKPTDCGKRSDFLARQDF